MKLRKLPFIVALGLSLMMMVLAGCGTSGSKGGNSSSSSSTYPTRPVDMVVPFGPGGSNDLHARAIVSVISKYLGQPMTVDLKAGGSGAVGSDYVAKSKPDGYTILFGGSGPDTSLLWAQKLPYTREDFIPICLINYTPAVIVVNADSPFKTLKQLLDYTKAHPNKLKYSSSGMYGAEHIPVAMLLNKVGGQAVHVPFNGGGPSLTALLGHQVDFSAPQPTEIRDLVTAGKLRALGISGTVRDPGSLKDVPTFKELGYDVVYQMGRFVLAPKGTPDAVVMKLRDAFKQTVQDSTFKKLIKALGEQIEYKDGPDFKTWWDNEYYSQEDTIQQILKAQKS